MKFSKINYIEHSNSINFKAFEEEAMVHSKAAYYFALSLTRNQEDANDLVQETYLKAFKYFNSFEKGSNCKSWLFMILKNTFINDYRKKKREPNKVSYNEIEDFYEIIKSDEIEDSQEEIFNNKQKQSEDYYHFYENSFDDDISKVMNELPENFRSIVTLCDLEGYSYEEIAAHVNCPIGTVRSRLHRARKMLHSKLYKYAEKNGYLKKPQKTETRNKLLELEYAN